MRSLQESYLAIVNNSAHLIFRIFELKRLRTPRQESATFRQENAAKKSSTKVPDVEAAKLTTSCEIAPYRWMDPG
jgi:hypothetical protein